MFGWSPSTAKSRTTPHALEHVAGMVVWPLVTWPVAALVMWITRRVAARPAAAASQI